MVREKSFCPGTEGTSGEIEGTCENRSKQCGHIGKEEAASPVVSTQLVSLTLAMEAKQGQKV